MKTLLIYALMFCWGTALAQSFGNLDFEKGRVPLDLTGPGSVTPEQAAILLPDWETFTSPVFPGFPYLIYDTLCLGSPCVDVSDRLGLHVPIQGNFTVGLAYSGIRQTAAVPNDARSVVFKVQGGLDMKVAMNGNLLSLVSLGQTGDITTFGSDISVWSGQVSEISFLARSWYATVDDIRFSPVIVVPEPSTWAMIGLGLAALACSFGRRTRR